MNGRRTANSREAPLADEGGAAAGLEEPPTHIFYPARLRVSTRSAPPAGPGEQLAGEA